jgi:phospholipase/lecithinase/hemolysin
VGGTDNSTVVTYGVTGLDGTGIMAQAALFALTAPIIAPSDLFVVWGGGNDVILDPSLASAAGAVSNLVSTISTLYGLGARTFLVPDMPDLALTPGTPDALKPALHLWTTAFNNLLASALAGLMLPDARLIPFSAYNLLNQIVATPDVFGLSNVTDACLSGDILSGFSVCSDPSSYLFWDSLHPTAAGHAIIARAFLDAVAPVPEPATLALMGIGVAVAARRMRGRRRQMPGA